MELFFDQYARALRGEARPFAILSEMRALEEDTRLRLIGRYQAIFRSVRAFFGGFETEDHKRVLTARTHILSEALFWSEIWLEQFAIGDFPSVRRRMLDILQNGIATSGTAWTGVPLPVDAALGVAEREDFLRVATRLINEIGYKGASVERITGELSRTKGSFYHHVEAKDDLVAECSRYSYHRLAAIQIKAGGEKGSPWYRTPRRSARRWRFSWAATSRCCAPRRSRRCRRRCATSRWNRPIAPRLVSWGRWWTAWRKAACGRSTR